MNKSIESKLDELGIISINASGDFSEELVLDVIETTEEIYNTLDLKAISDKMDKMEAQIEQL